MASLRPNAAPAVTSVLGGDIFLIDGATGVRALAASSVVFYATNANSRAGISPLDAPFNCKFDGVTNDTAGLVAAIAAAAGSNLIFPDGKTALIDPISITQTLGNVPKSIRGNGCTLKARAASASPLLLLENTHQGGVFEFEMSDLILDANSLHAYPLKIHGGQHMSLRNVAGKNGATGGNWLSGEPGFGIYSNRFIGLLARSNAASGFIVKSINNSGLSYINANSWIGCRTQTNTTYGFDVDYGGLQLHGCDIENNTLGGFNLDHTFQCDIISSHIEANSSGPQVAIVSTANTNFLRVIGGLTLGTITAGALTNPTNDFQTSDSATLISWRNGIQYTSNGIQLLGTQGIGLGIGPLGAGNINSLSNLSLSVGSLTKMLITNGVQIGLAAGGDPGTRGNLALEGALLTSAPITKTGTSGSQAAIDSSLIINASGAFTLTLQSPTGVNTGRLLTIKSIAAQTVSSASSNVVPLAGGAAGTAILAATAGKWALLQSDGTNWIIMASN